MTRHHRGTSFQPRLEFLDDRACPSCTLSLVDGVLTITGDDLANNIAITDRGPLGVRVACDGATTELTESIDRIAVDAGGGNDTVRYGLQGQDMLRQRLELDLGDGDDVGDVFMSFSLGPVPVQIAVNGGDGADRVHTGGFVGTGPSPVLSLTMSIDGGDGNDQIINDTWFLSGTANVTVNSLGGNGNDLIFETYVGFSMNGTFAGTAHGGNGEDIIDTALGWEFSFLNIGPAGQASYNMTGGNGDDLLHFISAGRVDGQLNVQADGGNGDDTIDASQMWVNVLSTRQFATNFLGGNGNDEMTIQLQFMITELIEVFPGFFFEELLGFTDTPAPLSALSITADGGNGFDTCLHSTAVSVLNVEDEQPI